MSQDNQHLLLLVDEWPDLNEDEESHKILFKPSNVERVFLLRTLSDHGFKI